ncbi:putative transcription factor C2H2 family [Helianthus annuus]|nr:putative transcription factor C2H2 family [Helianthus annuus]KAJ0601615.1 putative transcription factor C2H2 family [Helianthus annuus]KAJ0768736.1 putative transcription factor C2H2 family [Helianthus annuus]KAJ0774481.1 putative transcription factor C2H2 family [Helianthus annuus]KAJ0944408.1 putative transcription factor C2H2 family [Helianthus annuus]
MAVEASHFTLFSPPNIEMMYQNNGSMAYGTKPEKLLPAYHFRPTDAFPATVSRKRSRDSSSFIPVPFSVQNVDSKGNRVGELTFLAGDISSQMYQQQSEIDRLIAHHTEKVRSEMEQIQKQNTMRMITAVNEAITKRLKTKEDEYLKIGRLNWTLEEKVKSLNIENQILKELVQTNEATANALRNKLQQVLAQVQQQQQQHHHFDSDAQSYCGSNYEEDNRQVAENDDGEGKRKVSGNDENEDCKTSSRYGRMKRWCRRCEKEESCVLLLPCRHLCVCTLCVSSISFCPVCNVAKTAGVMVNMSSS